MILSQVPPPPPPPAPLLATTGTELLGFALLIAAGVWMARRSPVGASRFVMGSFVLVSSFYLIWPQDSGPQREADRVVMHGMASLVSGLMNVSGTNASVDGISVLTTTRYTMARGCMGLTYLAMAVLCCLCYPAGWRRRIGAASGIAAGMILMNALRILLLYHLWVGGAHRLHDFVHRAGGFLFAAFCVAFFVAALRSKARTTEDPAVSIPPGMAIGEAH